MRRWTTDELRAFTQSVADAFNDAKIRAPVHLSGGNELDAIEYFATEVKEEDYVFTYWRSHYHCLLKGVPPKQLFEDILSGRSITLCYPGCRILSSAIVAGQIPIALGVALDIKRARGSERVHCFMGDMTARTGIAHECRQYAQGHQLPIVFIEEDNGKSVCTPTSKVWGEDMRVQSIHAVEAGKMISRMYELPWPHAGAGRRVNF